MPTPSYSTYGSVKSLMPDTTWGTTYDALFTTLIGRASRLVDGLLHREPGAFGVSTASTRYFKGNGKDQLYIGELAAVPSVVAVAETGVVDNANNTGGTYTTWSVSDYMVWPYNSVAEKRPILRLDIDTLNGTKTSWYGYPKAVKITGYFGFAVSSSIPDEIVQAVEIQTIRWFKRGQQAFQDAGAKTDLNQLRYVKKLDPDIEGILSEGRFAWVP